jgi:hypothetical protein
VGSGLTRPDFSAWFPEFVGDLDTDHPTTAVIMFGANDEQSIRDDDHRGYLFGGDGWKRVYGGRVNAILAELVKRKIAILWVGLPIMRKPDFNDGAKLLDEIFARETKAAGGTFLPLDDDFKGPDGGFATHLPDAKGRMRQVRADDGVHFSGYGYGLVAEKVYDAILGAPVVAAK